MKEYKQPEFYKFNVDSIELAKWMFKFLDKNIFALEIGIGCGVITSELYQMCQDKKIKLKVDAIEIQEAFRESLEANTRFMHSNIKIYFNDFMKLSMNELNTYDVIYFNPPYFFEGQGRDSMMKNRQTCRRIKEEDLIAWFEKCSLILNTKGSLFFSFRDEKILKKIDKFIIQDRKYIDGAILFKMGLNIN